MKLATDLTASLREKLAAALAGLEELVELPEPAAERVRAARAAQLELLRALDDATALVRRSSSTSPGAADRTAASVLIVGDDATRATVAGVLGRHFQLREAPSGAAARAAIAQQLPDVVVADADDGGAELCRALKGDPALASLPVVLLTGVPGDGLDDDADDVVVEPFHAEELVSRLRNLVALRQKERELVATLDELRDRRSTLDEDLQQARSLQLALLPRPPSTRELRVETVYRPAEVVGGDLVDIHVAGRRHRFFLADTTGHGLRASLQTMVVKTAWDRHKAAATGPGDALARLNEEICTLDPGLRTRVAACCFDVDLDAQGPRLSYATAGHPPLLLARDGEPEELWLPSTFVGLVDGVVFEEASIPLRPGDRVVAFSDGLVEQWSASGERIPEDQIVRALAQPGTLADVILLAFRLLERMTGGAPPADDVTLVAVEIPR